MSDTGDTVQLPPDLQLAKENLHNVLRAQAARRVSRLPELRAQGVGLATIRTPAGQNITPAPHVRRMCDEIKRATGADSFGTYLGHEDSPETGVDIFPFSREHGDEIAQWLIDNGPKYKRRYLIWFWRIWNEEIGAFWRKLTDRGSPTANHEDHVHNSAYESDEPLEEEDMPLTQQQEDDIRYAVQAATEIKDFLGSFDREIPEGEKASFWDGQVQLRDDLRHSGIAVQELKDWFGQFDPSGKMDYWEGRKEVERRLNQNR